MSSPHRAVILSAFCTLLFACGAIAQQAPNPAGARILLLPRRIVSGERATLAVLDVNGRLTPGVTVAFSNGDRLTTDQSIVNQQINPATGATSSNTNFAYAAGDPNFGVTPKMAAVAYTNHAGTPASATLYGIDDRGTGTLVQIGTPGNAFRVSSMTLTAIGLWSGASSARLRISVRTESSTRTGVTNFDPPCTTRTPSARPWRPPVASLAAGADTYYIHSECDYKSRSFFQDELHIHTRVGHIGNSSITFESSAFKVETDELVATGKIVAVCVDPESKKPVRVPEMFRQAVARYEGNLASV